MTTFSRVLDRDQSRHPPDPFPRSDDIDDWSEQVRQLCQRDAGADIDSSSVTSSCRLHTDNYTRYTEYAMHSSAGHCTN